MQIALQIFLMMVALTFANASIATCTGNAPCICTILSTGMGFGNYSLSTATPTTTSATVTVTCTSGALGALSASFTISSNLTVVGNSQRFMTGLLSGQLLYNLYTTNSYSTIWGDGTVGTATLAGSCSQGCLLLLCGIRTCSSTFTIYGAIPAAQNVRADSYTEVVIITVTF